MITTRCKFYVTAVKVNSNGPGVVNDKPIACTVYLNAVYSSDINNENHAFHKATPNGSMEFSVWHDNGKVDIESFMERFKPGKMFYIDLVEAPKPD